MKSNAILLAKDGASVGVGMGQVNRVDSAKLAVERAGEERAKGSYAASDAFFPFPDGLEILLNAGVKAVVQPGGSVRDELVVEAAKKAGVTMYFTGTRHFFHSYTAVRALPRSRALPRGARLPSRTGGEGQHFGRPGIGSHGPPLLNAVALTQTFRIDWRYRARDHRFGRYARQVRRAGGLVVPAHPHATCIGCNWKFGLADADAVEVWNGPWTPDDEIALAEWDNALVTAVRNPGGGGDGPGRWLPAVGNSDAHREPDRVGHPQTVVLADALSRQDVLAGIRAGRSYLAESAALSLSSGATDGRGRHAGIGGRLRAAADAPVTVRLEVTGAAADCTVRLVTDQGPLLTTPLPASGAGVVEWRTTPAHAAYVRAEVRHAPAVPGLPGAFAALTNPVFLDAEAGTEG
ncbi:Bifunctional purine biosynthesis protein PurH [Streptomyces canarius]